MRWLLYSLYERHLLRVISGLPMPQHVGIILDGNRRYAKERGLTEARDIYGLGARKLDAVLEWCDELRIPAVTLWVCSTENLRRSREEVSGILAAIEEKLGTLTIDPAIHRRRIRVRAAGKLGLLPESTATVIRKAEEATASYDSMTLTIAVAYGGREEIVDAVRSLIRDKARECQRVSDIEQQVTAETIAQYLYAPELPDPELIIRTSGEIRLSGFLLWQSAFSEFYFSDVYWPEFRKIDFLRAIRAYQRRRRRFGI
jgi:short-chain Z-isoprenyl diphosphate synthase